MRPLRYQGPWLVAGGLVLAGCAASTPAHRTTKAQHPGRTTTTVPATTTTTAPFSIEPCGGITTDQDTRPWVDLSDLLVTAVDVPKGFTGSAPRLIPAKPGRFFASVPSSTPVATVSFGTTTPGQNPGAESSQEIAETIGEVQSATLATQLAASVNAAAGQSMCTNGAPAIVLPGSVKGLVAVRTTGQTSAGQVDSATVVAADGPYIVNVTWTNAVTLSAQGGSVPALAPLPSAATMAALVDAALAKVPS